MDHTLLDLLLEKDIFCYCGGTHPLEVSWDNEKREISLWCDSGCGSGFTIKDIGELDAKETV